MNQVINTWRIDEKASSTHTIPDGLAAKGTTLVACFSSSCANMTRNLHYPKHYPQAESIIAVSITVEWGQADTPHILVNFVAGWAWDDFYRAVERIHALLDDSPQPVPIIMDFSHAPQPPHHLLVRLRHSLSNAHPQQGAIYFVGVSHTLLVLLRTLVQSSPSLVERTMILADRQTAMQAL